MNRTSPSTKDRSAPDVWPSEFLGQIFEHSLNEIFVFDAKTLKFLRVNDGARSNLGYSMAELASMTPVDIKPDFDVSTFVKLVEPIRNRKDVLVFETIHARKDGSRYPVEVHLQHMLLEDTEVFAAIIMDLTDRKIAESELRRANESLDHRVRERTQRLDALNAELAARENDLERIFDAAPDAIVLVDRRGVIERVNTQAQELFGYGAAEMRGQPVEMLIPQRFHATHVGHRDAFTANPRVREMGAGIDLLGRRKDGTEVPIDVNLSPIELGGQSFVSAAIRDFTEHRAIEEALRHAMEKSDRATNTKSRFLATASHDLRQPLQSLGLYLSVLARQSTDPKALEVTGKMRRSLDVMGDMLDALLDISKFESGSITPDLCDIEVQELFDQIEVDNGPIAAKKGLELSVAASPLVIHSDPALLGRIIDNYVTNAIRYTDEGRVRIVCEHDEDTAIIAVTDTGIGIPAESLDVIFDEYHQLENQARDRRQGLGIGLAIVKYIAQLLGHEIDVQSTPGDGSTFSVRVPVVATAARRLEQDRIVATKRPAVCSTVLLVDDDAAIIDATTMLLESEGFNVVTAFNADDAFEHCKNGLCPDVVVSDYRLPGLSGIDVINGLRDMGDARLPAVLMTGDTATRKIEDTKPSNCTVVHKPINTDRLIDLIHELGTTR